MYYFIRSVAGVVANILVTALVPLNLNIEQSSIDGKWLEKMTATDGENNKIRELRPKVCRSEDQRSGAVVRR